MTHPSDLPNALIGNQRALDRSTRTSRKDTNMHAKSYALATALLFALSASSLDVATAQDGDPGVALPHVFRAGDPARASEVNENFTAVADAVKVNRDGIAANKEASEANQEAAAANKASVATLEGRVDDLENAFDELAAGRSNAIVVAKAGGDFDSVVDALEAAKDASEDEPFVVLVFPGVYPERDLVRVPPFVHLQGVSRTSCILSTSRSANAPSEAAAAISLSDGATLSDLTVRNDGAQAVSIGVLAVEAGSETRVENVRVEVRGAGGTGHMALHLIESDVLVRGSELLASGASIVNAALASTDGAGPFAQPRVVDCDLSGEGPTSGFGVQMTRTAITIERSRIEGDARGVSAGIAGISRVRDTEIRTANLNPCYETTGSATILSINSLFIGGNNAGLATSYKFLHCAKSNLDAVVDGVGSTITP